MQNIVGGMSKTLPLSETFCFRTVLSLADTVDAPFSRYSNKFFDGPFQLEIDSLVLISRPYFLLIAVLEVMLLATSLLKSWCMMDSAHMCNCSSLMCKYLTAFIFNCSGTCIRHATVNICMLICSIAMVEDLRTLEFRCIGTPKAFTTVGYTCVGCSICFESEHFLAIVLV